MNFCQKRNDKYLIKCNYYLSPVDTVYSLKADVNFIFSSSPFGRRQAQALASNVKYLRV